MSLSLCELIVCYKLTFYRCLYNRLLKERIYHMPIYYFYCILRTGMPSISRIDEVISDEIPDKDEYPYGYVSRWDKIIFGL